MIEKSTQFGLSEATRTVVDTASQIADALPENHYWGFSAYTMLLPYILKEVGVALQIPQSSLSGPIWNYLDAACSAVVGIQQLSDTTNHRSTTTKIKGAINLANGVQLATLTAVNFSLFGGPGFALAFGIGFALSLDETIKSVRRFENFSYWLKDSLSQLEKTNALIKSLDTEITELKNSLSKFKSSQKPKMAVWALEHKLDRLHELRKTKTSLEKDITARLAHKKYEELSKPRAVGKKSKLITDYIHATGIDSEFTQKLKKIDDCNTETRLNMRLKSHNEENGLRKLGSVIDYKRACEKREKEIQGEEKAKIKAAVKDNFVWGMAFVGMLLLCIPTPATQIAGLAIVSLASALYIAKNADRIYKGISQLATKVKGFFSEPPKEKELNSDVISKPPVSLSS